MPPAVAPIGARTAALAAARAENPVALVAAERVLTLFAEKEGLLAKLAVEGRAG